jgi:ketosteroid isomerase-like protein
VSQENVEIVRQAIDAYGRRDVEAMRLLNSPDVVLDWSASRGWLAGVYRGWDEVMRFYADYYDAFEEITFEVESYMPVGNLVVVPNVAHQRGRDGIEVSARAAFVFTLHDGKITRLCLYQELPEALKAVGLEE